MAVTVDVTPQLDEAALADIAQRVHLAVYQAALAGLRDAIANISGQPIVNIENLYVAPEDPQ